MNDSKGRTNAILQAYKPYDKGTESQRVDKVIVERLLSKGMKDPMISSDHGNDAAKLIEKINEYREAYATEHAKILKE